MGPLSNPPNTLGPSDLHSMTRKIKYEISTSFDYSQVVIEVTTDDGELITPEELDTVLHQALDEYSELDLGAEIH